MKARIIALMLILSMLLLGCGVTDTVKGVLENVLGSVQETVEETPVEDTNEPETVEEAATPEPVEETPTPTEEPVEEFAAEVPDMPQLPNGAHESFMPMKDDVTYTPISVTEASTKYAGKSLMSTSGDLTVTQAALDYGFEILYYTNSTGKGFYSKDEADELFTGVYDGTLFASDGVQYAYQLHDTYIDSLADICDRAVNINIDTVTSALYADVGVTSLEGSYTIDGVKYTGEICVYDDHTIAFADLLSETNCSFMLANVATDYLGEVDFDQLEQVESNVSSETMSAHFQRFTETRTLIHNIARGEAYEGPGAIESSGFEMTPSEPSSTDETAYVDDYVGVKVPVSNVNTIASMTTADGTVDVGIVRHDVIEGFITFTNGYYFMMMNHNGIWYLSDNDTYYVKTPASLGDIGVDLDDMIINVMLEEATDSDEVTVDNKIYLQVTGTAVISEAEYNCELYYDPTTDTIDVADMSDANGNQIYVAPLDTTAPEILGDLNDYVEIDEEASQDVILKHIEYLQESLDAYKKATE